MLAAVTAGASHPAVAGLLGLGGAGLAGAVVAMAWSVHARQIKLAEQLSRRQLLVTPDTAPPAADGPAAAGPAPSSRGAAGRTDRLVIDGPDTVVTGEQARFRVPRAAGKVVSWAVGGGSLAQSPDPAHPDELLLIADQPGDLMVTVWVREGLAERRATKTVTAVPNVTPVPPVTLRLFLHAWGLVVVAVLIVGFAGALAALGDFTSSDFIAVAALLAALLGVIAVAHGAPDADSRPGGKTRPWDVIAGAPQRAQPPVRPAEPAQEPNHQRRVG
jgi:hypothetical protein